MLAQTLTGSFLGDVGALLAVIAVAWFTLEVVAWYERRAGRVDREDYRR